MDRPGVLNRVASLCGRATSTSTRWPHRQAAYQPDDATLHGDAVAVEMAAKQLYRLIDVLKVQDVTQTTSC